MDNSQTQEEQFKIEEFECGDVSDFCEDFRRELWMLRALGALLENADLSHWFGSDYIEAEDYRRGLKQIIDMITEHYREELDVLEDKAWNNPKAIIEQARNTYDVIQQGGYRDYKDALERTRGDIKKIAVVISEFGNKHPEAGGAHSNLKKLEERIISMSQ